MNENSLQKSESRTFLNCFTKKKSKRKNSKFLVKIRGYIFIGVILFFYANVLWLNLSQQEAEGNKVPFKLHQPSKNRQLLSVVSINVDQLTNPSKAESISPAYHIYSNTAESGTTTNTTIKLNCTKPAILEFPNDGLTRTQRQHGWIVFPILVALYCFWSLAIICDDYLLPTIELICQTLQIQTDVVGATFMAVAISSPELFMNCIGTFVTKGDIGLSTIVGSSIFNLLAVPACCGIFACRNIYLDWWPISRDCLMYFLTVMALIATLWDGKVMWYESLLLFMIYFLYMAVMYYNNCLARSARRFIFLYRRKFHLTDSYREVNELTPLNSRSRHSCTFNNHLNQLYISNSCLQIYSDLEKMERSSVSELSDTSTDVADTPWQRNGDSLLHFILRWPITFLLYITIPDCRKHPRAKYLTLIVSILWLAVISYGVAYAITVIGDTLNIPDSVMGLTILSAGMSVPDIVSSVIITKQGDGDMGISNSIATNTFGILICLSVPWFIKAYFLPNQPNEMWVMPGSRGLTYLVIIFLLASVSGLFLTLLTHRFKLNAKVGGICALLYLLFIVCAVLIELNVFFTINLPMCEH